ncbi:MAG: hypothetical protein JWP06_594 [Candidatus Saccharibacteria bacterium]|nr:hypothetical protein [Candidatus Saccharibacteria bacterium]
MLDFSGINFWAVVVAWIINIAVGAFWYSPAGFAKPWQKHTGIDLLKIPQKKATKIIISVAISAIFQALTLAVIIHSLNVTTATNGFLVGFILWLGLTAATTVGVTLYSNRSWKFLWLNSSYFLVVMAVNSVILAIWR